MPKKRAAVKKKTSLVNKPVTIEWVDACTHGGWHLLEEYKEWCQTGLAARSIGWVIIDNKNAITLIQTMSDNKITDSITIPRQWIKKITRLT